MYRCYGNADIPSEWAGFKCDAMRARPDGPRIDRLSPTPYDLRLKIAAI
jgi:hypothetical protein